MSTIEGITILEVWDYRLSTASPLITRVGGTWVAEVWSKNNPDYVEGAEPAKPLATFDTKLEAIEGDEYDTTKVSACYAWFLTVRDEYSLPDIEERKPLVAEIRAAAAKSAAAIKALAALGEV